MYFKENLISGNIVHEEEQFNFIQLNNEDRICPESCICWRNLNKEYTILDCKQVDELTIKKSFEKFNQREKIIQQLSYVKNVKVRLSHNSPMVLDLFKPILDEVRVTFLSLAFSNLTSLDNLRLKSELKVSKTILLIHHYCHW